MIADKLDTTRKRHGLPSIVRLSPVATSRNSWKSAFIAHPIRHTRANPQGDVNGCHPELDNCVTTPAWCAFEFLALRTNPKPPHKTTSAHLRNPVGGPVGKRDKRKQRQIPLLTKQMEVHKAVPFWFRRRFFRCPGALTGFLPHDREIRNVSLGVSLKERSHSHVVTNQLPPKPPAGRTPGQKMLDRNGYPRNRFQ